MEVQTKNNQTIITISNEVNFTYLQDFLDYLTVKSTVAKSKATEKQIVEIAEQAQSEWWIKNKKRFIK